MRKRKTVEQDESLNIAEQTKIKELEDKISELEDALFCTSGELEEIRETLSLVTHFIREQDNADLSDQLSCYELVTFIQRYRIILEMVINRVNTVNSDIDKVL